MEDTSWDDPYLGRCCLDLESDRQRIVVSDGESLFDELCERSCFRVSGRLHGETEMIYY